MSCFIVNLSDLVIEGPAIKFDPDQPRDPAGTSTGGQWTEAAGFAAQLSAEGAKGIEQAILEVHQKGMEDGHEHAVIVDNVTGELLMHIDGEEHEIEFGEDAMALIERPGGNLSIVHNHPLPRGLSVEDLGSLSMPSVRSITAVGVDGSVYTAYRMHDAPTGTDYMLRLRMLNRRVEWPLLLEAERLVKAGDVTNAEANMTFSHLMYGGGSRMGLFHYDATLRGETGRVWKMHRDHWRGMEEKRNKVLEGNA